MSYRVQTKVYTGPFDLLLSLVSKQKLAIGSISIAEIADQYLEAVASMEELDLDVASDFVLVASSLLDIKAASLVPLGADLRKKRSDYDDDDDDFDELSPDETRELLIARLIAYKQFRNAGAALNARMEAESCMLPRTAGPDPEFLNLMPDYLEGISLRSLAVICADLFSQRESFLLEAEHIAPKRIPLALTVASVDRLMRSKKYARFSELLDGQDSAEAVVATFLAVLELFKRGLIDVRQREVFGEIELSHVEGAQAYTMDTSDLDPDIDGEWV